MLFQADSKMDFLQCIFPVLIQDKAGGETHLHQGAPSSAPSHGERGES